MSREININRQLLGLEDILFGTGTVEQTRGGQLVTVTKVNAGNLPFDETRTLIQWAQSVNVEALGSMITELQAIYDNLASINNVDDNLSLLNNIISNITVLQELHTNLSILQNVNSNIAIITEVNTNLDILTSIYNNLSALVNIHTNLTSLLAIDTNMQQLLAIDTNLPELLSINTNIVPNIIEILDVNNKAEQVTLDKQVVESLASQVTMDKQDINTMKLAVETIYDTFDDRFLGAKDIDPLVDNDGNALLDGALYFNTLSNALKVYVLDITTWVTIPQIYLSSLLDVQLTSITTNSILTWNGAKWVNTTTPVFDSIKLTGTNYGVMSWNTEEQVPSITLNSDVDIDLGESLILVKNSTGSTILDGRVVMAIGSNGNSGNILVSLHSGLKADAKRTIGIATQNILNDSIGFVTKEGKVKGINTTGSIYGETWVDGDILYVKANGALTKVEPLDSQLKMPIAFVIHAHTNGTLYVRTLGIDENHDKDFINNLVDIHSKTAKTTLADADEFMTADSTSTFSLKKITWASIKTLLANLFIPKVASTDNAIVRFNGTTGDVQDSGIRIDDAGNILINKLLGGVTTVSMTDGTGNTNLILPESGIVATTADINNISLSGITAYHLLQGNLAVSNSTITQGFNTTLYTGNGSTQSINTGIDMDTQWGSTAEERFGGLVWLKSRSAVSSNHLTDSIRGVTNYIFTNNTDAAATASNIITSLNNNGFSLGNYASTNTSSATYASWNFQTTHRVSGTTNHGKAYTCHYNPFTGFTIVKYEGSGIAGHEIPHHLGRKLGLSHNKRLSTANNWVSSLHNGYGLNLNITNAQDNSVIYSTSTDSVVILSTYAGENANTEQHILYGWANSYFDEANKLIGNYEIGVYQGTGARGNKVTTRGKPAWAMIKRLDSTGNWVVFDNMRGSGNSRLFPNLSNSEGFLGDYPSNYSVRFDSDGMTFAFDDGWSNASGGQYLYMVAYDTNANGSGSYYPLASDTANVQINNALIPIAQGIDSNGAKNTILSKNETITGLTYTQGKNYVYCDNNGSYGVSRFAPQYNSYNGFGDYFDVNTNKWYSGISLISDDFNTDTGWIINGGATKAIVNGKLKLTTTTTALEGVSKTITTVVGKKYKLVGNVYSGNYVGHMWIGTALNTGDLITTNSGISTNVAIEFVARTTTTYISLFPDNGAIGKFATFDNVAIYPINNDGSVALSNATEITNGRNYLNHIIHADNDGGVLYVEELPKIEYKDIIKANELKGKNACTAWANVSSSVILLDNYNFSAVTFKPGNAYKLYFKEPMDNTNYVVVGAQNDAYTDTSNGGGFAIFNKTLTSFEYICPSNTYNTNNHIIVFGGKN